MGILDQLIEKKDLMIYIDVRIAQLKREQKEALKLPERKRGKARLVIAGRLKELTTLKNMIFQKRMKEYSKDNWGQVRILRESTR